MTSCLHGLIVVGRPFDSGSYDDEMEDDEAMDEEGRTRLRLKVSKRSCVCVRRSVVARCDVTQCCYRWKTRFGGDQS